MPCEIKFPMSNIWGGGKMIIKESRNRNTNNVYNKIYQAWYNMKQSKISNCLRGRYKQYKGWIFKFN